MKRYPRLRDEAERLIITHIEKCQEISKDQIILLNDNELAYINTNHKEFMGLEKYYFLASFISTCSKMLI